ncbi:hypothetical protein B0533_02130 [Sedimentibacter sp. SX930]|nr:hypothetical protein B0533_02130 [Sedimentibacter sp. SX930]
MNSDKLLYSKRIYREQGIINGRGKTWNFRIMYPNKMDAFKIAGSQPLRYIYQNNYFRMLNKFVETTYLSIVTLVI